MARIEYKLFNVDPIGLEQLSEFDLKNVSSFAINTTFQAFENKIELHVYTEEDVLIESLYDYRNHKFLQGSETLGVTGASELTLNPIQDAIDFNYELGGVKFVYNFLDNLYSEEQAGGEFFIQEISEDRTELRLLTNQLTAEEIIDGTNAIIEDLESESYFNDFRLNIKNNDLLIGTNIKVQDFRDFKSVIVKLYEPLPLQYGLKDLLTIERTIADSVAYRIETIITPDDAKIPTLKGPNFNIEEPDNLSYPTSFLSTNDLFSFPTNNTYRQVNSLFKEKGIELSIDYNDYSSFILFSSAEERLRNFKYKLELIETYQKNADSASAAIAAGNTRFLSGSEKYWKDRIDSITDNFDHYDRHLYYSSGSSSWPKQAPQAKPYIVATGSATASFFDGQIDSASGYDFNNNSSLVNTIPEYLREDPNSTSYSTFVNMLGQHFDNIWIYTKALSDKYDNDNRLDYGISKDLVQDTLRNFGVKIYNSFKSTDDLFSTFVGTLYHSASNDYEQSGSLIIASLSGSTGITYPVSSSEGLIPLDSLESYKRQISKRLYHNLPYLLKTKGTERGLKALIASFGVPTENTLDGSSGTINGLQIRTIGGMNTSGSQNFGPSFAFTSSLDKIRTDNTGSIVTGSTLSNYTSIIHRDNKYSDDTHTVEVGYSPSYPVNDHIVSELSSGFDIDDYIGDPRAAYSGSYELLVSESNRVITQSSPHHYGEFVRVLKFYDNVLFKMIKDFVPARSNIDTGIIIKPHLLERNKIKQVSGSYQYLTYTGSIDTSFVSGSQGGVYTNIDNKEYQIPLTASYTASIVTPLGEATITYHLKERARFDGELSGSYLDTVQGAGELNDENTWKYGNPTDVQYKGHLVELITCPTITDLSTSLSLELALNASASIDHTDTNITGGFVFSKTSNPPTKDDNIFFIKHGTGAFSSSISGSAVEGAGTYYIRGFVSSSAPCGIAYTDVQTLTLTCPSVTTNFASYITSSGFVAAGNFSSLGTGRFEKKGFIYSLTSSATLTLEQAASSQYIYEITSSNSTTGVYYISSSDGPEGASVLESGSTYYYRAFVSSSHCTAYGNTVSLMTSASAASYQAFGGSSVGTQLFACPPDGELPPDIGETYYYIPRETPANPYPYAGDIIYSDDQGTRGNYTGYIRLTAAWDHDEDGVDTIAIQVINDVVQEAYTCPI